MLWSFFPLHFFNIIAHTITFIRIYSLHRNDSSSNGICKKKKTSKVKSEQTHSNPNQRTEFIDFEFSMVKNNEEKNRIKRTYKIIKCQNRERDAAPTKTTTRMKESMNAPETKIKNSKKYLTYNRQSEKRHMKYASFGYEHQELKESNKQKIAK